MPIRFSQCEPMRDSRSAPPLLGRGIVAGLGGLTGGIAFDSARDIEAGAACAGGTDAAATPEGGFNACSMRKTRAVSAAKSRRISCDSLSEGSTAPPKLISAALSAKLVWLSRIIKGTNHEVSY